MTQFKKSHIQVGRFFSLLLSLSMLLAAQVESPPVVSLSLTHSLVLLLSAERDADSNNRRKRGLKQFGMITD